VPEHLDRTVHRHIDLPGALLCSLGLAGVVLALIEQPSHGWGDPLVGPPLAGGIACLVLFLVQERRSREPMLPLSLFRRRNFAVGNVTTLALYGGLGAAMFFLPLFLQQVAGYSPIAAGLSLLPVTVCIFLLSRRFGALADRLGPRLFMTAGPIVAGVGLLMLMRIGRDAPYMSEVFPAALLFGLGLSISVAPLTAAVLAGVEDEHAGVASGVNNAVARVAGLLAIAAVGAVVSAQFTSTIDDRLSGRRLSPDAGAAVAQAKSRPIAVDSAKQVRGPERAIVSRASQDASVDAFRAGALAAGLLAILGGLVSAFGIENPRRRVAAEECPGGAMVGASRELGRVPEPRAVPAGAVAAAPAAGHG
jgi:hypothetical protein